jgi:hypothetical protein
MRSTSETATMRSTSESAGLKSTSSSFVDDFMAYVEARNPHEPEFLQAVHEVVSSLVA